MIVIWSLGKSPSFPYPCLLVKHGPCELPLLDSLPLLTHSKVNQSAMTWYSWGQLLPAGMPGDLESTTLNQVKKMMPNLVPTTYEAANAYLVEESKKPKGEQDLHREMCVMVPLCLPKDRKVNLVIPSMKLIVELTNGQSNLCSSTQR